MSKRNVAWLVVIVAVGVVVWMTSGIVWALVAAGATLLITEVIERSIRKRRRAARGGEASGSSLSDIVKTRRRRR